MTAARGSMFGLANGFMPIGSVCLHLVIAMPLASVRLQGEQWNTANSGHPSGSFPASTLVNLINSKRLSNGGSQHFFGVLRITNAEISSRKFRLADARFVAVALSVKWRSPPGGNEPRTTAHLYFSIRLHAPLY
jgi:hypothetical protein